MECGSLEDIATWSFLNDPKLSSYNIQIQEQPDPASLGTE